MTSVPSPTLLSQFAPPLRHVAFDVTVLGGAARLTVAQQYRNDLASPVEVVYTFPLDGDTTVCGFRARIGDREVEGVVAGRDEAFVGYDEAMARGHTAALLDQARGDVFSASLGNLRAGESAQLELRVIQELHAEGHGWRLSIPTTIAARYTPAASLAHDHRDAEAITPPVAPAVPYGVSLAVRVHDLSATVASPSHAIRTERQDDHLLVTFAGEVEAMDRDIVLTIVPAAAGSACAWQEVGPDGAHYVAVDVQIPEQTDTPQPRDVVFVVDCSGSMEGASIEEARRALGLCVRALLPGDRFDVIRFGSRPVPMFGALVPYDEASSERALGWLAGLRADLGGTELESALSVALAVQGDPAVEGRPRRDVLLLTDGQVSNDLDLIALAAQHADRARISTFGIGMASASALVRELARVTRGWAEFVHPGERIEGKVLRTFGSIRGQAFPFALEGNVETAAPIPSEVVSGEPVRLLVRTEKALTSPLVLHMGGQRQEVPISPWSGPPQVVLRWARHRIRMLEIGRGRTGSRQVRGSGNDGVQRALEALGTRFGVVSSATSMVAIVRRMDDAGQPGAELYRVPVLAPGQRMRERAVLSSGMLSGPPASAPMSASPAAMSGPSGPPRPSDIVAHAPPQSWRRNVVGSPMSAGEECESPAASAPMSSGGSATPAGDRKLDRLLELLSTQAVDGHFPWSEALDAALRSLNTTWDGTLVSDVVATTRVVLNLLRREWRGYRSEWMAAARKAEVYLASAGHTP